MSHPDNKLPAENPLGCNLFFTREIREIRGSGRPFQAGGRRRRLIPYRIPLDRRQPALPFGVGKPMLGV